MEISFLLAAARRRLWLLIPFVILGALPGIYKMSSSTTEFQSATLLKVSPPTAGGQSGVFNLDRYITTETAIMSAQAEQVAPALTGYNLRPIDVARSVSINRTPNSDIVRIVARGQDPTLVKLMAETYAVKYIDGQRQRVIDTQGPEIKELNDKMAAVIVKQQDVDARITAVLTQLGLRDNVDLGAVAPALATERARYSEEYRQLLNQRTDLEQRGKLKISSEIVQHAPDAYLVVTKGSMTLVFIGAFVGAILGLGLCVLAARLSGTLLDHVHAEEILGVQCPHSVDYAGALNRAPINALTALPSAVVSSIDQICVRAEGGATIGESLTLLVTGTERGAGSTTLAVAMAGRYASQGARVLLIDADMRGRDISKSFSTPADGGTDALLKEGFSADLSRLLTETAVSGVKVLGVGDRTTQLRRSEVPTLIAAARQEADVILIDGGPVFDSASTLQMAQLVDSVVLAVPGRFQRIDTLEVIGRTLGGPRVMLLPVLTEPRRARWWVLPTFKKKPSQQPIVVPVIDDPIRARYVDGAPARPRQTAEETYGARGRRGGYDDDFLEPRRQRGYDDDLGELRPMRRPRGDDAFLARPRARRIEVTPLTAQRGRNVVEADPEDDWVGSTMPSRRRALDDLAGSEEA